MNHYPISSLRNKNEERVFLAKKRFFSKLENSTSIGNISQVMRRQLQCISRRSETNTFHEPCSCQFSSISQCVIIFYSIVTEAPEKNK